MSPIRDGIGSLSETDAALLTSLMLRGPQTADPRDNPPQVRTSIPGDMAAETTTYEAGTTLPELLISIALIGNAADVLPELVRRGWRPQLQSTRDAPLSRQP